MRGGDIALVRPTFNILVGFSAPLDDYAVNLVPSLLKRSVIIPRVRLRELHP